MTCDHRCNRAPRLKDGFALWEKLVWRLSLLGFVAVGFVALYRESPGWALFYAALACVGLLGVVLPSLCSHCPYPPQYSACLFLPHSLVRRFYPFRGPHMGRLESLGFLSVSIALVALPQLWLLRQPFLLLAFWALCLPFAAAFLLHYCRRCRHFACPVNRVPEAERGPGEPTAAA